MASASLARRCFEWYRGHDASGNGWHRALRMAVVQPAVFAFTFKVIGDAQAATFAAFGVVALLLFVDFSGDRAARLASYLMLALAGVVLIAIGTLASRSTAAAVVSMAAVGFAILFSGILSSSIAAASRAALLLFILPVMLPGPIDQVGTRIEGWAIAAAVSIPAAILVWPPKDHGNLRRFAAEVCAGIGAVVKSRAAGRGDPGDAECAAMSESLEDLRRSFRSTISRPVGLTTGSRLLIRLVDELEWLAAITATLTSEEMGRWSEVARQTALAAAGVLDASAEALRSRGSGETAALQQALAHLGSERRQVAAGTRVLLASSATGNALSWPYHGHEVAYAASLVGVTVDGSIQADARPVLARLAGRRPAGAGRVPIAPATDVAASQLAPNSVWLHNSIRGALGLALAVLFAETTGTQHAFWVVLGALSMLRTNALTTGATVVRALAGTLVGFVVGSVLVLGFGTSTGVLWGLLPAAMFLASLAPDVISFAAGQAGFTLVLLILFNIIAPVGWKVGLVRVEDVGLGAAASLIVGLLLWPRGATASIGTALAQAYRAAASYLEHAVDWASGLGPDPANELRSVLAADRRLDDALRQYLAERGPRNVPVRDLTVAANGAVRIRLAGEAIVGLRAPGETLAAPPRRLAPTVGLAQVEVASLRAHYLAVADEFDPRSRHGSLPAARAGDVEGELLESIRRDVAGGPEAAAGSGPPLGEAEIAEGARLLWMGLYLQDMRILEARLRDSLTGSAVVGQSGHAPEVARATPAAAPTPSGAEAARGS